MCEAGLSHHQTGTPKLFACLYLRRYCQCFIPRLLAAYSKAVWCWPRTRLHSVPEGDEVHQQMICYSLSNSIPTFPSFSLGSCQCTQHVKLLNISLQHTKSGYQKTSTLNKAMFTINVLTWPWILRVNGFVLASLHSFVSCGLKVHLQNWLAAATPAWHIHYNDLIMMISLMEAFFYNKRVKPILLYYCREVIIPKTKFKHVFHSPNLLRKTWKIICNGSLTVALLSYVSLLCIRGHYMACPQGRC